MGLVYRYEFEIPLPSPLSEEIRSWSGSGCIAQNWDIVLTVGGAGPVPESSAKHKWPIVSGSQGHDSEIREHGQQVFFFSSHNKE